MQQVFNKNEEVSKTSVIFLPMIDLNPNDLRCVYSTLRFVEDNTKKLGRTPICTFDQALWWNALQVLSSPHCDLRSIIIRLGGFHTLMSFLGSVGFIMAVTGLPEALGVVYATNTASIFSVAKLLHEP